MLFESTMISKEDKEITVTAEVSGVMQHDEDEYGLPESRVDRFTIEDIRFEIEGRKVQAAALSAWTMENYFTPEALRNFDREAYEFVWTQLQLDEVEGPEHAHNED